MTPKTHKTTVTLDDLTHAAWKRSGLALADVIRRGLAASAGPTSPGPALAVVEDQDQPDPGRLAWIEGRLAAVEGRLAVVERAAAFGAEYGPAVADEGDPDAVIADIDQRWHERMATRRDAILTHATNRPCIVTASAAAAALDARTGTTIGWLTELANHDLARPLSPLPNGLHRWLILDPADPREWTDDDIARLDERESRRQLDQQRGRLLRQHAAPGRETVVTAAQARVTLGISDGAARLVLDRMTAAGMAAKLATDPGHAHQWAITRDDQ